MSDAPEGGAAGCVAETMMSQPVEAEPEASPETLPLDSWHRARGARMGPFGGFVMPIQYESIVAEHQWTRSHASLFDVSHMGQLSVKGDNAAAALERIVPAAVSALRPGRLRYSLLLTETGGIIDDLIVGNAGDHFGLVVNGATKRGDIIHLKNYLPDTVDLTHHADQALLALQGPEAASVFGGLVPDVHQLTFMGAGEFDWQGIALGVSRSGYTGEDGFEISLPNDAAGAFAEALLADSCVKLAGLGARDTLRLEAGLPLYGHDLDLETDPISAGLGFAISRQRREDGGWMGHESVTRILAEGPPRQRVGLSIEGRLPAREGAAVFSGEDPVGTVTSGGFSPTLGQPIAMAYVYPDLATPETSLSIEVRNRRLDAKVVPLPFVPHQYHRAGARK